MGLSASGPERIDEAFEAHMRNEERLLRALTPQRRAQLESFLREWGGAEFGDWRRLRRR